SSTHSQAPLAPPTLQVTASTDRSALPSAKAIPIPYILVDGASSALDVDVTWVASGSTTSSPAARASGSEGTTGLASSPSGASHVFTWDADADLRNLVAPTGTPKVELVTLQLVPRRGGVAGLPVTLSILAGETAPR